MKRVYHPSANAWQDVDDSAVDSWKEAGWRTTRPKHVDDSEAPAIGDFHSAGVASDPEPVAEKSPEKPSEKD